jgi:hypothetical protein
LAVTATVTGCACPPILMLMYIVLDVLTSLVGTSPFK